MKMVTKILLTAAVIAALSVPALAADKLIVKNAGGTADVFKVADDGTISANGGTLLWSPTAGTLGIGTGGGTPGTQITIVDESAAATRGLNAYQMTNDTQAGVIVFRKSRGTYANPGAIPAASGDYVGTFHGAGHDGTNWVTTASLAYYIDAPVTTGNVPMSMMLMTGTGATVPKVERLRITSSGNVVIANKGAKTGTTPLAVSATDGHLYVPTVAGAVTSCATMTSYGGHAPLWIDTTNNKVCSCISGALKCTAAML